MNFLFLFGGGLIITLLVILFIFLFRDKRVFLFGKALSFTQHGRILAATATHQLHNLLYHW